MGSQVDARAVELGGFDARGHPVSQELEAAAIYPSVAGRVRRRQRLVPNERWHGHVEVDAHDARPALDRRWSQRLPIVTQHAALEEDLPVFFAEAIVTNALQVHGVRSVFVVVARSG